MGRAYMMDTLAEAEYQSDSRSEDKLESEDDYEGEPDEEDDWMDHSSFFDVNGSATVTKL